MAYGCIAFTGLSILINLVINFGQIFHSLKLKFYRCNNKRKAKKAQKKKNRMQRFKETDKISTTFFKPTQNIEVVKKDNTASKDSIKNSKLSDSLNPFDEDNDQSKKVKRRKKSKKT